MSADLNLHKNSKATIRLTLQLYSLSETGRTIHLRTTGDVTKNPAMNLILRLWRSGLIHNESGRLVYMRTSFDFHATAAHLLRLTDLVERLLSTKVS